MSLLFIGLVCALIALLVYYFRKRYSYWECRNVPYERAVFPFGSLRGIGKSVHFRDINERIYKRFKNTSPFAGAFFIFVRVAVLTDLELIRNVLIKDFSNFRDRRVFSNPREEPLTGHLFSLDGEQWHSLRLKLSPVFTGGKMKFMFPTIIDVGKNLIDACAQMISTSGDNDLVELCARYTTDVIGTCAFGLECNSLKDPHAEFREMGRSIFEKPRHSQIITSLIMTNQELAKKLHLKFFPEDVSKFFMNAVRRTVKYRLENNVKRNDFMDMLIEMMAKDESGAQKSDGIDLTHGLTLEQMAAQAFVFFIAGFHTSSTTMAFCLYELAMNQSIQDKLREEIQTALKKHDDHLNYELMKELKYLDQVLAETLRKYTVLPHLIRITAHDYKVPNTNYVLEAGTALLIPVAAIHNDPEYFPEPSKFDPCRFDEEQIKARHPMAYLPFGDGPRNCIGLRFGKMQAKIGLISLLTNFKFTKSSRTEDPIILDKRNFVIAAKNGVYLHAEKL